MSMRTNRLGVRLLMAAFVLLAGVAAICLPVFAHHGAQAYAAEETELKDVTVTEFIWANPHALIRFDVKDAQGNVTHWAGEMNSPSGLSIAGWNRSSVKAGDVITVYLHQSKTGNPVGNIMRVVLADGRALSGVAGRDASSSAASRGARGR